MPKKTRKKLVPGKYTTAEYSKSYHEAIASREIAPGDHLPELRPKAPKKK